MGQHFVEFAHDIGEFGQFTHCEIDTWDVDEALKMADEIFDTKPEMFAFYTEEDGEQHYGNTYFLQNDYRIIPIEELEKMGNRKILVEYMKLNGMTQVISPDEGKMWLMTEGDVIIER